MGFSLNNIKDARICCDELFARLFLHVVGIIEKVLNIGVLRRNGALRQKMLIQHV